MQKTKIEDNPAQRGYDKRYKLFRRRKEKAALTIGREDDITDVP